MPCFARQALEAARFVTGDMAIQEQILREVLRAAAGIDLRQPPPVIGQQIHRRLRELTGVADPYREAKERYNRLALGLLPGLSQRVEVCEDPLGFAVRLAIAGNIIDLGAKHGLEESEVTRSLDRVLDEPFAGDIEAFRSAAAAARRILYLTDNAGEIVFDRLLIERLPRGRVTVAVRGGPIINDATREDARAAGIDEIAEVTDNGSDAPGTVLASCSPQFRRRFSGADMVVAKGQGNFETLSGVEANLFFLLKVKCPVVAAQTGLATGTQALIHRGAR
jgi:hypothetical protein